MTEFLFTNIVSVTTEDGGRSRIVELDHDNEEGKGVFVRVQSWSETGKHIELDALVNTGMIVTIKPVRFKERG